MAQEASSVVVGGGGGGRGEVGGELYLHVGPARLLPLLKLFPQQQQQTEERAGVARATDRDIRSIKEAVVVTLKHGGISQDMPEEKPEWLSGGDASVERRPLMGRRE